MMLPSELLAIIEQGVGHTVEFKKSTTDITKDVYDTVCAFSNRDGGHIFLGVKDNGTILGIRPDCVERMKKDFVTAVNKSQICWRTEIFPARMWQNWLSKKNVFLQKIAAALMVMEH